MRIALVNPAACACGPDTPLELLYARQMLAQRGVTCRLLEGHDPGRLTAELADFGPTDVFFTTAPGYLLWPEPPWDLLAAASFCRMVKLASLPCHLICIGPHGTAAPEETLLCLLCDAAVVGEPEQAMAAYGGRPRGPHLAFFQEGALRLPERPAEVNLATLPALDWSGLAPRDGVAVEFSRGSPWPGRDDAWPRPGPYRERPLERVLAELDGLRQMGVGRVSFSDQVFGLGRSRELLRLMAGGRYPRFRARSWIGLWDRAGIELLAEAGCVGLELSLEPVPDNSVLARAEEALSRGPLDWVRLHPATDAGQLAGWRDRLSRLACRMSAQGDRLHRKPAILQRTD